MDRLRREIAPDTLALLDGDLSNKSIVKVVSQTKGKLFTKVESKPGHPWEVMTCRLEPIENPSMYELFKYKVDSLSKEEIDVLWKDVEDLEGVGPLAEDFIKGFKEDE